MRQNLAFVVRGEEDTIADIIQYLHDLQRDNKIHIIHYKVNFKKRFRIEPLAPY